MEDTKVKCTNMTMTIKKKVLTKVIKTPSWKALVQKLSVGNSDKSEFDIEFDDQC